MRERCELCGTRYLFEVNRPTESVAGAQRLCDTIWGNIGAHVAFQYLLVILLTGNLKGVEVGPRDLQLFQAVYHGAFLLGMAICVYRQVQSPLRVYVQHLFSRERSVYVGLYAGMWLIVLWGDMKHWFTIVNIVGIQTYLPFVPYFHKNTLEEMNKGQQRALLDWPDREEE